MPTIFLSGLSLAPNSKDEAIENLVTEEMEAAIETVSLKWSARTVTLETGGLAAPFAAMRTCLDDLVKSWGLDPEI